MKSYFLVLEGPDGSGKSSIAKLLKEYFDSNNIRSMVTREPGGTAIGEAIRQILLDPNKDEMTGSCEAFLYAGARAQHMEEKILPFLEKSGIVICDRFVHSSLAYQGHGRGLGIEEVMELNKFALKDAYPDRILFFDLDPRIGIARNSKTEKEDRFEEEDLIFHEQVYQGFKLAIEKYPKNVKKIDASRKLDLVFEKVLDLVVEDLNEINNRNNSRQG